MRITQIQFFLAAAEHKNFTKASKALYVTQSNLSQQIKLLEEELGVPLFFRFPRSVSLTPAGEDFYNYAKQTVNSIERIKYELKNHSDLVEGQLKFGIMWIFEYLPQSMQLQDFMKNHPSIKYQFMANGSSNLIKMLNSRDIDIAFVLDTDEIFKNPDIRVYKLDEEVYTALIPKTNPLAGKKSIRIEDLRGENIIMPAPHSDLRNYLDAAFFKAQINPEVFCESSIPAINADFSRNGFAISFHSSFIAQRFANDTCVSVPLDPTFSRSIYMAVLKQVENYPTVKAVLDYFR